MNTERFPARPKVVRANNALERGSATLDSRSAAYLAWCTHWSRIHTRIDPQAAVVIRRALEVYAHHLDGLADSIPEGHKITAAAKGTGTATQLTECRARIERHEFRPLRLAEAIYNPQELQQQRATMQAIEARLESLEAPR